MGAYVENLAYLLHDVLCNDTPRCPRWGPLIADDEGCSPHREHYRDMAENIISRLEPEIGHANVYEAVRVILKEIT